jgi:predicted N-formylglutamate amidohydrolase
MPFCLSADEPVAFEIVRADGRSPFLLVCDHAANRLPQAVGTLGLPQIELERHIAWDIGAAALARNISRALDAVLILQTYSRLVVDCNRWPGSPASIARISEGTEIPGNSTLDAMEVEERWRAIFSPYHECIAATLDARASRGLATVLVSVHSFTPIFLGKSRPWHIGVLYNRDVRLARHLLELLRAEPDLFVGDNEPYTLSDQSDYTIPVHGEQRGLAHVELEIRQDLLADETARSSWSERLVRVLSCAAERLTLC